MTTTTTADTTLKEYLVSLWWGDGFYAQVDLRALSERAAAQRARLAEIGRGWLAVDEPVQVRVETP